MKDRYIELIVLAIGLIMIVDGVVSFLIFQGQPPLFQLGRLVRSYLGMILILIGGR